jgi:hypothetical protein
MRTLSAYVQQSDNNFSRKVRSLYEQLEAEIKVQRVKRKPLSVSNKQTSLSTFFNSTT